MFCTARKRRPHCGKTLLQFERLEARQMMSATPPTVLGVEVVGTSWTSDFKSYLQSTGQGAIGYEIPLGSAAQTASLTWKNIDQIAIKFSEDVHVKAADLSVS